MSQQKLDPKLKGLLTIPVQEVDAKSYNVGVIIARLQSPEITKMQKALIEYAISRHNKVVVLLGVARVQSSKKNPLDYSTREKMVNTLYPEIVCAPVMDMHNDNLWSEHVDFMLKGLCGDEKVLLYGGRDSFIPYYKGRYKTQPLDTTEPDISATKLREIAANTTMNSKKWRSGVIHGIMKQRPVSWMTVDIAAINDRGEVLLAKKKGETKLRFIGGFVDRSDKNLEVAILREFKEEAGGVSEVQKPIYVGSSEIDEERYKGTGSGIKTSLFMGGVTNSVVKASDDIVHVEWVSVEELKSMNIVDTMVQEHVILMEIFLEALSPKDFPYNYVLDVFNYITNTKS